MAPLNLNTSQAQVNSSGINLNFQIYPLLTSSPSSTAPLLSVNGYLDLALTNNSQSLSLSLYSNSGAVASQIAFSNYSFRFNFWSNYSITVTSTSAALSVDGSIVQTVNHSVALPSTATTVTLSNPQSLSYLISGLVVADSRLRVGLN